MSLLRLKKDDIHKENTMGKIAKRRQKVYACSDTDFGEFLFHYVMLATKKIRIFQVGFIAFANSKKTAFATPLFLAFKYSVGQFSQIVKILGDFIKAN